MSATGGANGEVWNAISSRSGTRCSADSASPSASVIGVVFLSVRVAACAGHHLAEYRSVRRLPTPFDRPRTPG
jgi:hypothetical protein